ncbi:unnamed protein product, partial [Callosobruchus maculatus]
MEGSEAGPSNVKVLTRRELFDIMQHQNLPNMSEKLDFLENYLLGYDDYNEAEIKAIKHNFSYYKSELKRRWNAAHSIEEKFIKKNNQWLEGNFTIPKAVNRPGRPAKTF